MHWQLATDERRGAWRADAMLFFISAVTGWIYEVLSYWLDGGGLQNRGFLYGPYLPVYGFGALLLAHCLERFRSNRGVVFLLGAALSGALEWAVGEAMWALYGMRWWNYTGFPMSIRGFVCLQSALAFGAGGLAVVYWLRPAVNRWLKRLRPAAADGLCLCVAALPAVDFIAVLIWRHPI